MRRFVFIALLTITLLAPSAFAGMVMAFYAIPADEAIGLTGAKIQALLEHNDPRRTLDIDKAWHGIHFLLVGQGEQTKDIRSLAIFGGKEIGDDVGYGPARLLTVNEVKAIARALKSETTEKLRPRYDPKKMEALKIYPEIWVRDGTEALTFLLENYAALAAFYEKASASNQAILIALF